MLVRGIINQALRGKEDTMRLLRTYTILLLCLAALLAFGGLANASPTPTDPKDIVFKAFDDFHKLKNYHTSLEMQSETTLNGEPFSIALSGEGNCQNQPIVGNQILNMTISTGKTKTEKRVVQYFEEAKDQVYYYTQIENHWLKQTMPKNMFVQTKSYDNYAKAITKVELKTEDDSSAIYEVTASGPYLKATMEQYVASMGMSLFKLDNLDIGDLTYTLVLDKKTARITQIYMDMSPMMEAMGNSLTLSVPIPETQKMFRELYGNMKITMKISFSRYNSAEKVTIPEEVKKQAQ